MLYWRATRGKGTFNFLILYKFNFNFYGHKDSGKKNYYQYIFEYFSANDILE